MSLELLEARQAQDALIGTYKATRPTVVSGAGCRLTMNDGQNVLDFVSGIGVNALGYASDVVARAVASALATGLVHTSNLYRNHPAQKLASLLTDLSFADKVFFCNSGAEANEAAFKFARRYAREIAGGDKHEIVALKGSFHGRLFGSLAATDRPAFRAPFEPLMPAVRFILADDVEGAAAAITRDRTAAVIVEPVQGEGGVRPLDPAFLKLVRALATANDAVLIFDEVQCGLGRTGTLFAYEQMGVVPDIVTLAKPLAGGLPMGATLVAKRIADTIKAGDHATTFGGGPLVSSVALAVVGTIQQQDFLADIRRKGEALGSALRGLADAQARTRAEVRGLGLMWGIEFDAPVATIVAAALEKGLLVTSAGDNVIRLLPPLVVSDDEIAEAVAVLRAVWP